jgi:hypothetical protein
MSHINTLPLTCQFGKGTWDRLVGARQIEARGILQSNLSPICLAPTSLPDVAGQIGARAFVAGRVEDLGSRPPFDQFAQPQKDDVVGQAARLAQ